MLPGVGIFGYDDPSAKILIQLLTHFGFEIHGIWTNNSDYEEDDVLLIKSNNEKLNIRKELITTSIDNVLLNKNVNLVFVCCQPTIHSQIVTKALGNKNKKVKVQELI
jgi:predicted dehydrogenase